VIWIGLATEKLNIFILVTKIQDSASILPSIGNTLNITSWSNRKWNIEQIGKRPIGEITTFVAPEIKPWRPTSIRADGSDSPEAEKQDKPQAPPPRHGGGERPIRSTGN